MSTATTTGRRLYAVPTAPVAPETPPARAVPRGVPAREPWSTRTATCARAVDEAAATAEHAAELVHGVRLALLGGHPGAATEHAVAVLEELRGLSAVLGEVHGELDELAHAGGPEGSA